MSALCQGNTTYLLSIDIHARQPTSEPRMRVIPPNNHLWSTGLFQHVEHFSLKDVVDRFDRHGCTCLGHGKDVHDGDLEGELSSSYLIRQGEHRRTV